MKVIERKISNTNYRSDKIRKISKRQNIDGQNIELVKYWRLAVPKVSEGRVCAWFEACQVCLSFLYVTCELELHTFSITALEYTTQVMLQ